MANRNNEILKRGLNKVRRLINKQLCLVGDTLAEAALIGAIEAYDKENGGNLTGNTRMGFRSAYYIDGKLKKIFSVSMVTGEGDMKLYVAYPGDRGFADYDNDEYIGADDNPFVRPYKDIALQWQGSGQRYNVGEVTEAWLKSYKPDSGGGLDVVVANRSEYGAFLVAARHYDILGTEAQAPPVEFKTMLAFSKHPMDSIKVR